MDDKKPIKKKKTKVSDELPTPNIFVNGMTQEQAVQFIGTQIEMHRTSNKKSGWTEEALYVRHQLVLNWLSQGMPSMDVHRLIRETWGVASSTASLYIKEAMQYLTRMSDEYRDDLRAHQIAKLERWAEECRLMGKYLEASKFLEQVNKIQGLYVENKKVELTSDGPIKVTFDR